MTDSRRGSVYNCLHNSQNEVYVSFCGPQRIEFRVSFGPTFCDTFNAPG